MSDKVDNALFICTHNSARSIMAEALLNAAGRGAFKAYSAGSHPRGEVLALALQALDRMRLPSTGCRSKDWNEFAAERAPTMDFVFIACDKAAGEFCPAWPGQPITAHWAVPDPSAASGDDDQRLRVYMDVGMMLKWRIDLLTALPLASPDRLALQRVVREIGTR